MPSALRRRSDAGYGRLICDDSRASSSSRSPSLVVPATAGAAVNGGLKQFAGATGCHSGAATTPSGCTAVRGLGTNTGDAVITKDGKNVYVASVEKDAIVAFDRNLMTGRLTQKSSITGCFTSDPAFAVPNADGCNLATADTNALDQVTGLALSDGGSSLYATTQTGDSLHLQARYRRRHADVRGRARPRRWDRIARAPGRHGLPRQQVRSTPPVRAATAASSGCSNGTRPERPATATSTSSTASA